MAKIVDIQNMCLEELRPYIQRALELEEWPSSDWVVVGIIFNEVGIQLSRAAFPLHTFSTVIMDKGRGAGIGTGNDPDPLVSIFRAYLKWRSNNVLLQKNKQI